MLITIIHHKPYINQIQINPLELNRCAIKNSKFPSCNKNQQQALQGIAATPGSGLVSARNFTQIPTNYVDNSELLWGIDRFRPTEAPTPLWFNTLCLITFLLVFRFLGYLVLRSYHKPS